MDYALAYPSRLDYYSIKLEMMELIAESKRELLTEGMLLNSLLVGGAASYLVGFDKVKNFILKVIDIICRMISFLIRKFKELFKWFTIQERDAALKTRDFLARYETRLRQIPNFEVEIEGYRMDRRILPYADTFGWLSDQQTEMLITNITTGEEFFTNEVTLDMLVAKNRATILQDRKYDNPISDNEFKIALKEYFYGSTDKRPYRYTVLQALQFLQGAPDGYERCKQLQELVIRQNEKNMANLERQKRYYANLDPAKNEINVETIRKQLSILTEYRAKTFSDCILAYEMMLQCILDLEYQAKFICIRALQLNIS